MTDNKRFTGLDLDEKVELLRKSYIFNGLETNDLKALAAVAIEERSPRDTILFHKDDEADGMRIIIRGLVRIWVSDENGAERSIRFQEQGDVFGEIALLDGLPRSANVAAAEECVFLLIRREAFLDVLSRSPQLTTHVIELLCERLRYCLDDIGDLSFLSARERLLRKLAELAFSHADISNNRAVFNRKFTQLELSHLIGVSREVVNRHLAAMVQEGAISMQSGIIEINDFARIVGN